jgi:hypothetical protein
MRWWVFCEVPLPWRSPPCTGEMGADQSRGHRPCHHPSQPQGQTGAKPGRESRPGRAPGKTEGTCGPPPPRPCEKQLPWPGEAGAAGRPHSCCQTPRCRCWGQEHPTPQRQGPLALPLAPLLGAISESQPAVPPACMLGPHLANAAGVGGEGPHTMAQVVLVVSRVSLCVHE